MLHSVTKIQLKEYLIYMAHISFVTLMAAAIIMTA